MDLLLAYDVATPDRAGERRLRKVAKIVEGFGVRVQDSVFELVLDEHEVPQLLHRLELVIDPEVDSVRLYRVLGRAPTALLGQQRSLTTTRGPVIL